MTSIFVDDAGSPIVDAQGNILIANGEAEMRQRIVNIFSTPKYSETLFPEYGFNFISFMQSPPYVDKRLLLQSLVAEALNNRLVPSIKTINSIGVTIEDNVAEISLSITDKDGQVYENNYRMVTQ